MAYLLEIKDLTPEMSAWLIKQFALRKPETRIKQDFTILFDGQTLKGEEFLKFQTLYKDEIHEQAKYELRNLNDESLSFTRLRLQTIQWAIDIIQQGYDHYDRIVDEEGKMATVKQRCINWLALAKMLDLAQKELIINERLKLELIKNNLVETWTPGIKPIAVRLGNEDDASNPIIDVEVSEEA